MGSAERRNEIMKILCRRRNDTICNLASEFGVSERTIRRDIEILSLSEPIYTRSGRYGGGVYVMEEYVPTNLYMSNKESEILDKVYLIIKSQKKQVLTSEEMRVFEGIVKNYSKPQKERKRNE